MHLLVWGVKCDAIWENDLLLRLRQPGDEQNDLCKYDMSQSARVESHPVFGPCFVHLTILTLDSGSKCAQ